MRIGFGTRDAREFSSMLMTHRVDPPSTAVHVVDRNLSLLSPLGFSVADVGFPLPGFPAAAERIDDWFRREVGPGDRLVALLPATRQARKQWPPDRYLALALRLRDCRDVRFVVPIGAGEEALARPFADALGAQYLPLPQTFVPELCELFRRVELAVGNDTGPLHLAAAVGARAIGLFGPTRGERNGPYGPNGRWISSDTGQMSDIPVDAVYNAAREWLKQA